MEAPADRVTIADRPRGDPGQAFEVFVRDDPDGALRHVGSVHAESADDAYRRATRLFAWFAADVWVCPARSMTRYATHDLDDRATDAPGDVSGFEGGDEYEEPRNRELS